MKLSDAVTLAAILHDGQRDKAGALYLAHPVRVMLLLPPAATLDMRIAALLHDTLEDTAATVDLFHAWRVPQRAIDLVSVLTRRLDEPRRLYLERIACDPDALQIKLADIGDNMDAARLSKLPTPEAARLLAKYSTDLATLQGLA